MFWESMSKLITVTLTGMFSLVMAKTAVFSAEGILNGICLPSLMADKPERGARYGKMAPRSEWDNDCGKVPLAWAKHYGL